MTVSRAWRPRHISSTNQLTYSYGTHVAHVAVDPETGKVEVLRYVVVEDIGRCINPLLVQGQTVGAAVQGIGSTLLEELVYDAQRTAPLWDVDGLPPAYQSRRATD